VELLPKPIYNKNIENNDLKTSINQICANRFSRVFNNIQKMIYCLDCIKVLGHVTENYTFYEKIATKIYKFISSVNRSIFVKIGSNLVCMLILPYFPTTCKNFKSFGALLDIASFSFLDHDFQNKKNLKKSFNQNADFGQLLIYRGTH